MERSVGGACCCATLGSAQICDKEKDAEDGIDQRGRNHVGVDLAAKVEEHDRNGVNKLFQDSYGHEWQVANGVESDQQEEELKQYCQPDKAIIELGMGNGRRCFAAKLVLQEIQRHKHEQTVN